MSANKAYRDSSGNLQEGSTLVTMAYDGLGRRISRAVQNSADLDCTYHDSNHRRPHSSLSYQTPAALAASLKLGPAGASPHLP